MEVLLVILVALGLFFWFRSKQSKTESNQRLCYFEHEDKTHSLWCINFQTMLGTIPDHSYSFHVRRVSSSEWQYKWTDQTRAKEKSIVVEEMAERKEDHQRDTAKLEQELSEAKSEHAKFWQEMASELEAKYGEQVTDEEGEDGDEVVDPVSARIAEKIKAEQEEFSADIQKLQEDMEKLGSWTSLPDYMIGALETQYQRYLIHGEGS